MTTRRRFIQIVPMAGTALLAGQAARAELVNEKDANAVALGYVADAKKVDKAKFKNFVDGSHCGNCQLFQGGAAEAGNCPLFAGKQVANAGWCSAWAKKA